MMMFYDFFYDIAMFLGQCYIESLWSWRPRYGQCICCATPWFRQRSCSRKFSSQLLFAVSHLCGLFAVFCTVSAVEPAIFLQAGGSVIFCDSLALIWLHHAASTPAKTHLATAQPRISWYAWNVRSVYPGESQAILATFSKLLFDIMAIFWLIQASTVWGVTLKRTK